MHLRRDDRRRRVRAHAAGVRAAILVEQTLVVLARRERERVLAVDHDDEARFLAVEEFLDHDACACVAELVARQHHVDRFVRFLERHRDDHALAGREAVGLHDDRRAFRVDVGMRGGRVREGLVVGGRNAVPLHERLREILRALELRGFARRPEDLQAARAEQVDDAGRERRFGPDERECDAFAFREVGERVERRDVDVLQTLVLRRAAIAGRDIDHLNARRLRELPRERMFAATGTDDE